MGNGERGFQTNIILLAFSLQIIFQKNVLDSLINLTNILNLALWIDMFTYQFIPLIISIYYGLDKFDW